MGPDLVSIVPGIITPTDLALLMYKSAKTFLTPRVAEWRLDTLAMSQRVGRQGHFFFELITRALMIYAGCPAVAAKKPGLVVPEMIYDYVRGVLSETVLEIDGAVIQGGENPFDAMKRQMGLEEEEAAQPPNDAEPSLIHCFGKFALPGRVILDQCVVSLSGFCRRTKSKYFPVDTLLASVSVFPAIRNHKADAVRVFFNISYLAHVGKVNNLVLGFSSALHRENFERHIGEGYCSPLLIVRAPGTQKVDIVDIFNQACGAGVLKCANCLCFHLGRGYRLLPMLLLQSFGFLLLLLLDFCPLLLFLSFPALFQRSSISCGRQEDIAIVSLEPFVGDTEVNHLTRTQGCRDDPELVILLRIFAQESCAALSQFTLVLGNECQHGYSVERLVDLSVKCLGLDSWSG